MTKKQRARFFCEFCNTEVEGESRFCPKCGRFFASVRCPACGQTGEHSLFIYGCPACGYAMDGSPIIARSLKQQQAVPLAQKKKQSRNRRSDDALPIWVYVLCSLLLIFVLKIAFDFLR